MLSNSPVPKLLFKYCKLDHHFYKLFRTKELWFQRPSEFNDPFDCNVCWSGDLTTDDIDAYVVDTAVKMSYTGDMSKVINEFQKKPELMISKYMTFMKDEIMKQGVSCFSKDGNNPLMWAHYSASHTGVCIGFDGVELVNSLDSSGKLLGYDINYATDFPKVSFKQDTFDALHRIVSSKSNVWEYEKEYRLVIPQKGLRRFSYNSIIQVCFGLKTSDSEIKKAVDFLKQNYLMTPALKLFKSVLDNNSYKIHYIEIVH